MATAYWPLLAVRAADPCHATPSTHGPDPAALVVGSPHEVIEKIRWERDLHGQGRFLAQIAALDPDARVILRETAPEPVTVMPPSP
jgi:hypothetical protein